MIENRTRSRNISLTSQVTVRHFSPSQYFWWSNKNAHNHKRNRWLNCQYLFTMLLWKRKLSGRNKDGGKSRGGRRFCLWHGKIVSIWYYSGKNPCSKQGNENLFPFLHFNFFLSKITMNYPSKAHLICKCLRAETVIWRLSDALWAYIFIWLQKQLVHRLVYVSKIRQDVNDRKEIGGRLLLTL